MTNITEDEKDKFTRVELHLKTYSDLFKGGIPNAHKWKRKYRISKIIKILNII